MEGDAMTEPIPVTEFCCPSCLVAVQEEWVSCPKCGQRLKPGGDLVPRALGWSAALAAFVLAVVLIYPNNPEGAIGFAVIFGLPLCYIFGKAVMFRMSGRPLTWHDLGMTTLRTALVTIGLVIVLPVVIGMAAVLLLLAVCSGMMVFSG